MSLLLTHIRLEHADQPNFQIQCNLQGCKQTFKKFTVYRNHIYQYHDADQIEEANFSLSQADDEQSENEIESDFSSGRWGESSANSNIPAAETSISPHLHAHQLQKASVKWLLKISEIHKISQVAMNSITADVQSLFDIGMNMITF